MRFFQDQPFLVARVQVSAHQIRDHPESEDGCLLFLIFCH
jgi:hypothetical protein